MPTTLKKKAAFKGALQTLPWFFLSLLTPFLVVPAVAYADTSQQQDIAQMGGMDASSASLDPSLQSASSATAGTSDASVGPGSWKVQQGESIEHLLNRWGKKNGWTVVWNSQYLYTTQSGAAFQGSMLDAIKALSSTISDATPKLYMRVYTKNKVIVVDNNIDQ